MRIEKQNVVTIEYTLTDNDGGILDTSRGGDPLAYIHGVGFLIPGLEAALEGHLAGETLTVDVPPEDGYGEWDEALQQTIPLSMFGKIDKIEIGMQFNVDTPNGGQVVTVVDVTDDDVTVDGNHPLAGVHLNFDVTIIDVRPATAEELTHGHVHGANGHHHH